MYEVNVTTSQKVFQDAGTQNSGRACFLNQDGRSSCGLGIFGSSGCCTM